MGSPRFDPATGDPLLPDRAALYTTADAVLLRSDVLTRLAGAELEALAGYVLGGGTLAVAVVRPEDVRHPTIAAFAGGAVRAEAVSAATLAELPPVLPTGMLAGGKVIPAARAPSDELAGLLAGYAGGNLHGSLYGSSAAYGLGEVHLLAFDPSRRPAVDDPWAQARVVDLARRAFDRRSTQVFRPGAEGNLEQTRVRKQLDPNEGSRWAIGAAAVVLIAYAVLAGQVNFSLARRAGRPLRALRWLPILSVVTFALVLGIGSVAKGVRGRARHLTLVEAGAGMPRGSARRFRGFYTARAGELTVLATGAGDVLSTLASDSSERRDHLLVDRDGARLADVAALPWQTVVVLEDGFASLGDGIALVPDGGGAGRRDQPQRPRPARGHRPRARRGLLLPPHQGRRPRRHLPRRRDRPHGRRPGVGEHHHEPLPHARRRRPPPLPRRPPALLEADAPGLAEAWAAVNDAAGDMVDWFPGAVPVLIGQLDGGEGRSADAGLRLEQDRLLVRVVGYGGRP